MRVARPHGIAVSEILDYFGKCLRCQYPASAVRTAGVRPDGSYGTLVIATCDLPCGWRGPVPLTRMTGRRPPGPRDSVNP
jgi:hypothetical protein